MDIKALLIPISDATPAGEDPKYIDVFSELKSEIEKPNDVDYQKIVTLADTILTSYAKDLRVCAYYGLAMAKLEGVVGLLSIMDLITGLINEYDDQLWPKSNKARKGAFSWLHRNKTLVFARQTIVKSADLENQKWQDSLKDYFEGSSAFTGSSISWPECQKYLDEQIANSEKASATSRTNTPTPNESLVQAAKKEMGATPTGISMPTNGVELQKQVRLSIRYCKESKLYAQSVSLSRSLLWSGLKLPSNEAGVTKLPYINNSRLLAAKQAFQENKFLDAFLMAEDLFLEPGGLFSMEVQKLSATSAAKLELAEVENIIKMHLHGLITQIPQISTLSYSSGEPFSPVSTQTWLATLLKPEHAVSNKKDPEKTPQEKENQALAMLNSKGFDTANQWLKSQPEVNEYERLSNQFIRSKLLIEIGKSDMALLILESISESCLRLKLDKTMPEFCLSVWKILITLLEENMKSCAKDEIKLLEKRKDFIKRKLCIVDVDAALEIYA